MTHGEAVEFLRTAADDIRRGYSFDHGAAHKFEEAANLLENEGRTPGWLTRIRPYSQN